MTVGTGIGTDSLPIPVPTRYPRAARRFVGVYPGHARHQPGSPPHEGRIARPTDPEIKVLRAILQQEGIAIALAQVEDVRLALDRLGITARIGTERIFATVQEATDSLAAEPRPTR